MKLIDLEESIPVSSPYNPHSMQIKCFNLPGVSKFLFNVSQDHLISKWFLLHLDVENDGEKVKITSRQIRFFCQDEQGEEIKNLVFYSRFFGKSNWFILRKEDDENFDDFYLAKLDSDSTIEDVVTERYFGAHIYGRELVLDYNRQKEEKSREKQSVDSIDIIDLHFCSSKGECHCMYSNGELIKSRWIFFSMYKSLYQYNNVDKDGLKMKLVERFYSNSTSLNDEDRIYSYAEDFTDRKNIWIVETTIDPLTKEMRERMVLLPNFGQGVDTTSSLHFLTSTHDSVLVRLLKPLVNTKTERGFRVDQDNYRQVVTLLVNFYQETFEIISTEIKSKNSGLNDYCKVIDNSRQELEFSSLVKKLLDPFLISPIIETILGCF